MLDLHKLSSVKFIAQSLVLIADVTFFERESGILVFRSQLLKQNIYWKEITQETPGIYREARKELKNKGFVIKGIVFVYISKIS